MSNPDKARLGSKASRIEQDPASAKIVFDIDMEIRWIQAIGIGADEACRDSQRSAKRYGQVSEIPTNAG
jgi:hypothetical protein